MVIDGYPQDLRGFMNILNNYITEHINNRHFRNTPRKQQAVVTCTQTKEKYAKYNKKTAMGGITVSTTESNIIGHQIVQI